MMIDGAKLTQDQQMSADVLVIGTGASGAVVGKELAEAGLSVVFVEEGGAAKYLQHNDLGWEAVQKLYRNQGFFMSIGKPFFPLPLGKAVGGTTTVNSGTCFRAPEKVFARWQNELGLTDLSTTSLDPYYSRVEQEIHVSPADFTLMGRSNTLFHEALQKKGFVGAPLLRNVKDCAGSGMCCYGCPTEAKQSMDISYIPKALKSGATLFTHCRAEKTLREGHKIFGIEARFIDEHGKATGKKAQLRAKITVLAGGTVYSPVFLKRNKLSHSPWLGKNLSLHPASKVYAEFDERVHGWTGIPQAYYSELMHQDGILLEGVFVPPDIAAFMNPFGGKEVHQFMSRYDHMATFGIMVEDEGRGKIWDLPWFGPVARYDLDKSDAKKLQDTMAFLAEIFLGLGAKRVIPMLRPELNLRSPEEVQRFKEMKIPPKQFEIAAFHPLGTARMGTSTRQGVVDSNGKLFELDNLYLCDGSAIPTSLGVNPQLTIMAFATRLAEHLRQTYF